MIELQKLPNVVKERIEQNQIYFLGDKNKLCTNYITTWHKIKIKNNAFKRSRSSIGIPILDLILYAKELLSSHDSYNQLKAEHKLKQHYQILMSAA